jgi:hypothetical protein
MSPMMHILFLFIPHRVRSGNLSIFGAEVGCSVIVYNLALRTIAEIYRF